MLVQQKDSHSREIHFPLKDRLNALLREMNFPTTPLLCTLFCLLCFNLIRLSGQKTPFDSRLNFKNFSVENGLSNTSVSSICEDTLGYIWIGSKDGLNRYDGSECKVFREEIGNKSTLSHNWVRDITKDSKGKLWIATKNGLNLYDYKDTFQKIGDSSDDSKNLTSQNIYSLCKGSNDFMWVGTDKGLNLLNINTGNIQKYQHKANANSLSSNIVRKVFQDSQGRVWIQTDIAVDLLSANNLFTHYAFDNKIISNEPTDIFEDKSGKIWIGNASGLFYFDYVENVIKSYNNPFQDNPIARVRALSQDKLGNMWIGTYTGLYIINDSKGIFTRFQHKNTDLHSLPDNSVYEILHDKNDNVWIGTWWGGLSFYDINTNTIEHFSENDGLSFHIVSSFAETENGDLWIGTEGGGVNYFSKNNKSFKYFKHSAGNPNSISLDNVQDVVLYENNKLIIGTHGKGIDVAACTNQI